MIQKFSVKIHKGCRLVIAICDAELIDNIFEEGKFEINLTTTFFKGDVMTEEELKKTIYDSQLEDASFNIVGERSIEFARGLNLVKDEGIIKIDNIPCALVLL